MIMTEARIMEIVTLVMGKVLKGERERTDRMLEIINEGTISLRKETQRLIEETERLMIEPRCPVCGRSNRRKVNGK